MEQFKVVSKLGDTLFGQVLHCQCQLSLDSVAVKSYDKRKAKTFQTFSNVLQDSIIREQQVFTKLEQAGGHENIVRLYRIHERRNEMLLIMEYCDNRDLCAYLERQEKVQLDSLLDKFDQVLLALEFLHNLGYAHRDLSLENVLLTENGDCKLCDFGLATSIHQMDDRIMGKERYMAPEVAEHVGKFYSPRETDIWALGIMLFVLLTGQFPFQVANPTICPTFRYFVKNGLEATLCKLQITIVPPNAIDLLDKMLKIQPFKRITLQEIQKHPLLNYGN